MRWRFDNLEQQHDLDETVVVDYAYDDEMRSLTYDCPKKNEDMKMNRTMHVKLDCTMVL